jgi:branched-chain amino acid transport system substrate-binding protein
MNHEVWLIAGRFSKAFTGVGHFLINQYKSTRKEEKKMEYQRRRVLEGMMVLGGLGYWVLICLGLVMAFPLESMAVKPESFNIALVADLTGPYAPIVGPFAPGCEDGIRYVNEELGGIDGVKLKLIVRDNTGKVALGLQQYAELVEMKPKPFFIAYMHSPTAEAVREKHMADGVIGFCNSSGPDLYPQANSYGWYALYPEQLAVAAKWAKDNFKEKRNLKVGILTWDTAYGRSVLVPEFFDYCKNIGVDIVANELFGVRDADVTTQMIRIRAKNPDWLLTNTTAAAPMIIMKAAKELGMDIKLLNGYGGDWASVRMGPELFEGCITVMNQVSFDDEKHFGMKRILEYMSLYKRGIKEKTGPYVAGWQYALVVHKVVKDAVAKVGWDKLDLTAIKNEMSHITNWEPMNGVVRVTYTDKIRSNPWLTIFKITGGKFIDLGGGFIKAPDLRPAKFH